uniref:Kazal-like domain-containing protein n=1 Tax=Parascaris univalens TaxID=6257 RepID=A0A914ZKP9_PARUN
MPKRRSKRTPGISRPCCSTFTSIMQCCILEVVICAIAFQLASCDESPTPASCNCDRQFKPVCASDGYTYNNLCQMICQRQINPGIRLLYEGTCCPAPSCPSHIDPVCDDEGRTHANECAFHYFECLSRKTRNKALKIAYRQACFSTDPCKRECEPTQEPVCDSASVTHPNMCMFQMMNCERERRGEQRRNIAHIGKCDSVAPEVEQSSPRYATDRPEIPPNQWNSQSTELQELTTQSGLLTHEEKNPSETTEANVGSNVVNFVLSTHQQSASFSEILPTQRKTLSTAQWKNFTEVEDNSKIAAMSFANVAVPTRLLDELGKMPFPSGSNEKSASGVSVNGGEYVFSSENSSTIEKEALKSSYKGTAVDSSHNEEATASYYKNTSPSYVDGSGFVNALEAGRHETTSMMRADSEVTVSSRRFIADHTTDSYTTVSSESAGMNFESRELRKDEPPQRTVTGGSNASIMNQTELKKEVSGENSQTYDEISPLMIEDGTNFEHRGQHPDRDEGTTSQLRTSENDMQSSGNVRESIGQMSDTELLVSKTVNNSVENGSTSSDAKKPFSPDVAEGLAAKTPGAAEEIPSLPSEKTAEGNDDFQLRKVLPEFNNRTEERPNVLEELSEVNVVEVGKRTQPFSSTKAVSSGLEAANYSTWRDVADPVIINDDSRFPNIGSDELPCSAVQCDKNFEPVCDSNGRTHRNACLFRFYQCKIAKTTAVRLQIAYPGQCDKLRWRQEKLRTVCGSCSEEREMIPICDNRNKTHQSICQFTFFNCEQRIARQEQRVLVHLGPCHSKSPLFGLKEEVCPSKCGREYEPVCDSHGTTHPNLCTFQQYNCRARKQHVENVAFLNSLGACAQDVPADETTSEISVMTSNVGTSALKDDFDCPEPHCSNTRSIVCDSEGRLHRNECLFAWARCLAAREGRTLTIMPESECETFTCTQNCSNDYQPVCSSDFITYPNRCFFHKAKCAGNEIDVLFNGECRECLQEPCSSTNENEPESSFICDHNEETKLKCEFEMLRCIYEKKYGYVISAIYEGRCCPSEEACPDYTEEICDSYGRTHKNLCLYEVMKCRSLKINGINLTVARNGSCESQGHNLQTPSTGAGEDGKKSTQAENGPSTNATGDSDVQVRQCARRTCPQYYQPVCGTDSKTYVNECVLHSERCSSSSSSLAVAYEGECCFNSCPGRWQPVCDSRDITHENLCEFGVHRCLALRMEHVNLTISRYDACEHEQCTRQCGQIYEPVCASNGETYRNECELKNVICVRSRKMSAGDKLIYLDYKGECCSEIDCDSLFSPVCDNEGKTHANLCQFRKAACLSKKLYGKMLTIQYERLCCNQPCGNEVKPVCDGERTYDNLCKFRIAQCEAEIKGEVLSLAYSGKCCEEPTGKCSTTGPLCDSEGQTHANMCKLLRKQCVLSKLQLRSISIAHRGECCKVEVCTTYDQPVCDRRGVTHLSLCHFRNAKCVYDKTHFNTTLQLDYAGACCASACDDTWDAVCDQHGILYRNKCLFNVKKCEADRRHGSILLQTLCPKRYFPEALRHLSDMYRSSQAVPSYDDYDENTGGVLFKSK